MEIKRLTILEVPLQYQLTPLFWVDGEAAHYGGSAWQSKTTYITSLGAKSTRERGSGPAFPSKAHS